MTTNSQGDRLPPGLIELVAHIVEPLGDEAAVLREQAESAVVVSYSPTMVDVTVPDVAVRSALADGPTPGRAIVYDDRDQPVGEVLLWVRSGLMIGLEQAWFTDEPPVAWPSPSQVRL
jgi:hypothetical protein